MYEVTVTPPVYDDGESGDVEETEDSEHEECVSTSMQSNPHEPHRTGGGIYRH